MAIALLSVVLRHERRIRLVFTNDLAMGAFGVPGPTYYAVENLDGRGASPVVLAAMIVANSPTVVELALASDLVNGAMYRVTAEGVPAVDTSVTPAGTENRFLFGDGPKEDTREPAVRDRERLLYGVDLIWNGTDYQETATGDLERISGTANVTKALWRGIEANGLPWDPAWGGKAREYVDSPSSTGATLRGAIVAHVVRDPRVKTAKVDLEISGTATYLHVTPILVTGDKIHPVSVTVPGGS